MGGMEWKSMAFKREPMGTRGIRGEHAMTDLKDQVQRHEYKVDSQRVAEEMIRRMRFAHWARTTLLSDAGGGPGSAAAAH